MSRKRYTAEQIIHKLREAEVELSRGKKLGQIVRDLGITEQTYYRWRKEYGGLKIDPARRLRAEDVLDRLAELFVYRGVPAYIRSGNGPEFTLM